MNPITATVAARNWDQVGADLQIRGYAILPQFVDHPLCDEFKDGYNRTTGYRKTVVMERYRFGLGEYKYFDYPLPPSLHTLRKTLYSKLVPVANSWMQVLNTGVQYPNSLEELHRQCKDHNQLKPTPLILKYGPGGFNTLHQDLYGEVYFPFQAVLFLNNAGVDYEGGEFVLTQQVPRAQSKAIVLRPGKGDLLVFPTNFRPVQGRRGYYRSVMKHGVSEVTRGERYALGIIFHDAVS